MLMKDHCLKQEKCKNVKTKQKNKQTNQTEQNFTKDSIKKIM